MGAAGQRQGRRWGWKVDTQSTEHAGALNALRNSVKEIE